MRHARLFVLGLTAAIAACSASASDSLTEKAPPTAAKKPSAPASEPSSADDPEPAPAEEPAAARFVDTCNLQASACTAAPAGFKEGSGLAVVDRCAFGLEESPGLGEAPELVTALETITKKVALTDVLADANRTAKKMTAVPGSPADVAYAFRWEDEDQASKKWIPQGVTGSADADATGIVAGKSVVLVSFFMPEAVGVSELGVRIAFVDTTTPATPKYRFVLLVEPAGTAAAPSFGPVDVIAGGITWFGDFLYVADANKGFRVFDMRHILEVPTDGTGIGCAAGKCSASDYKYILPQVGKYEVTSACKPLFSFVSLDRSSDPPALVSGENMGALAARAYRWPLDPKTSLLRSKTTFPTEAFRTSHQKVQGGASIDGTYYFSSSAPTDPKGALYRVAGEKSAMSAWSNAPDDLMVDKANGWLWSLSEDANARAVFAVKLAAYPKP